MMYNYPRKDNRPADYGDIEIHLPYYLDDITIPFSPISVSVSSWLNHSFGPELIHKYQINHGVFGWSYWGGSLYLKTEEDACLFKLFWC